MGSEFLTVGIESPIRIGSAGKNLRVHHRGGSRVSLWIESTASNVANARHGRYDLATSQLTSGNHLDISAAYYVRAEPAAGSSRPAGGAQLLLEEI
jgi:hypothetical protein